LHGPYTVVAVGEKAVNRINGISQSFLRLEWLPKGQKSVVAENRARNGKTKIVSAATAVLPILFPGIRSSQDSLSCAVRLRRRLQLLQ
jgi:hypothetical protein